MENKKQTTFILLPFLLLLAAATSSSAAPGGIDITKLLSSFPNFASFSELLTQTGLDVEINSRKTITILAVDNSATDAVSGRPVEIVKNILSVHVILDYFDNAKLLKLADKTALLTTLFQSSGMAVNNAGFLNVTEMDDGLISFGSAMPGAGLGSNLVKEVVTKPYDISVLQVSDIIVPPGIEKMKPGAAPAPKAATPASPTTPTTPAKPAPTTTPATQAPTTTPTTPTTPAPATTKPSTPAPASSKAAPAPSKNAPAPKDSTPAPSSGSAKAPAVETPSASEAPSDDSAKAPATDAAASPKGNDADTPVSDGDTAAPAPAEDIKSASGRTVAGLGFAGAVAAACFAAF